MPALNADCTETEHLLLPHESKEGTLATRQLANSHVLILGFLLSAGCASFSATINQVAADSDAGENDAGGVTGGKAATSGASSSGGSNSGGSSSIGGTLSAGGNTSNGGASATGGALGTGGLLATGGSQFVGATSAIGGTLTAGGATGTGGDPGHGRKLPDSWGNCVNRWVVEFRWNDDRWSYQRDLYN